MSLFDTTFIIDLARSDPGAIRMAEKTSSGGEPAALSVVSVHEYLLGVHRKYGKEPKDVLREKLSVAKTQLEKFEVIPLTEGMVAVSASLQAELSRVGRPIGILDLFIAATALVGDLPLVTRDKKGFEHVPKLRVENY